MEGFKITLVDEADLYNWEVAIFGPPNTLYEGGYFKVRGVYSSSLHVSLNMFQSPGVLQAIYSNAPALYLSRARELMLALCCFSYSARTVYTPELTFL